MFRHFGDAYGSAENRLTAAMLQEQEIFQTMMRI